MSYLLFRKNASSLWIPSSKCRSRILKTLVNRYLCNCLPSPSLPPFPQHAGPIDHLPLSSELRISYENRGVIVERKEKEIEMPHPHLKGMRCLRRVKVYKVVYQVSNLLFTSGFFTWAFFFFFFLLADSFDSSFSLHFSLFLIE